MNLFFPGSGSSAGGPPSGATPASGAQASAEFSRFTPRALGGQAPSLLTLFAQGVAQLRSITEAAQQDVSDQAPASAPPSGEGVSAGPAPSEPGTALSVPAADPLTLASQATPQTPRVAPSAAPSANEELSHALKTSVRQLRAEGAALLLEPAAVEELCYALVALADEWLICQLEWSGRDAWGQRPLEYQLYGSCVAGRALFARMKALGAHHLNRETQRQLAAVYLLVLKLGFAGEWRADQASLAGFAQELRERLEFEPESSRLFPQAYAHCLSRPQEQRLASLRPWWAWCAAGLLMYWLLSSALWLWLSSPIIPLVQQLGVE